MARILALDYGERRTGIAVTDPLQLIASGLTTVPTPELLGFLERYFGTEPVERIVIGEPRRLDNRPSEVEPAILDFIRRFSQRFPAIPVSRQDERFSSKMAMSALVQSGLPKMKRRDKAVIDEVSATLILQSYLSKTHP